MPEEASLFPAVVQRAIAQLPPGVRETVQDAVGLAEPFLWLDAAEADAAEANARTAGAGAEIAGNRAAAVAEAIAEARARDAARFDEALGILAIAGSGPSDVDRLAALLDVDKIAASRDSFDAFMQDDELTLSLTPRVRPSADADERPGRIGVAADGPRVALSSPELARLCRPGTLPTSTAGRVTAAGSALLLGDGTAVGLEHGKLCRVIAPDEFGEHLRAARWASGQPPQLRDHAAAANAACAAIRDEDFEVDPGALPAALALGVAIPPGGLPLRECLATIGQLRTVVNANQAAAVLIQLAFELSRVRISLTHAEPAAPLPVIPVGQLRWCRTSARPIVWMPMFSDATDTVGGADRPWADGAPTGASVWLATSPALALDPEWAAGLVVVPGDDRVWCVAADGRWWDIGIRYDVLVAARRAHRDPWLEALEELNGAVPAIIAQQRELAVLAAERAAALPKTTSTVASDVPPKRFSREWAEALAERYNYADDAAARAAGEAAVDRGWYTHDEFLAVVRWKSARVVPLAGENTAADIEDRSRAAFAAGDELTRVRALLELRGVGVPVASALLHFAFPDRYPILDFRALATLGDTRRRTTYVPDEWVEYVTRCRDLAAQNGVSMRVLDKALWQASKDEDVFARSATT